MECRSVTFFLCSFVLFCSILNTSRAAPFAPLAPFVPLAQLAPLAVKNMQEAVAKINEMVYNGISQFAKGGPNCKDCENVKQLLSQVPADFFQFDINDFFQGAGLPFTQN